MRKAIILLIFASAAFSCYAPHMETLPRSMRMQDHFSHLGGSRRDSTSGGDGTLPGDEPYTSRPKEDDIYCTALHFPDSVDWRQDSLVAAEVRFFKNGELLLSLPVQAPPDPERQRISGGHLWTDSTDGFRTRILCDGKEMLNYEGEEQLRGFLVIGGKVHSLGQKPGNEGFTYRIDGVPVFSSAKGTILGSPSDPEWEGGALALDEGKVYYSYSRSVRVGGETRREFVVMCGDRVLETVTPGSGASVYDIRVHRGKVHRLENRDGAFHFIKGEDSTRINVYVTSQLPGKLVFAGDSLCARGVLKLSTGRRNFWYFDMVNRSVKTLVQGQSARSVFIMGGDRWLLADASADGTLTEFSLGGEKTPAPGAGFYLSAPRCLFLGQERWGAALTSSSGREHLILSGEKTFPVSFNGYFTSIRIE